MFYNGPIITNSKSPYLKQLFIKYVIRYKNFKCRSLIKMTKTNTIIGKIKELFLLFYKLFNQQTNNNFFSTFFILFKYKVSLLIFLTVLKLFLFCYKLIF